MLMIRPFLRYSDISGRSSRMEYWLFVALQSLTGAGLFSAWVTLVLISPPRSMMIPSILLGITYALFLLASVVPGLTLTIRRLHDTGRSGKWLALMVPGLLAVAQTLSIAFREVRATPHDMSQIMADNFTGTVLGMSALICQLTLFVYMILPGTPAANRYGEATKRLPILFQPVRPKAAAPKAIVDLPAVDAAPLPVAYASEASSERIASRISLSNLPLKPVRQATQHAASDMPVLEPVMLYREPKPYSTGDKPAGAFGRRGTP
jgi:uncharacterized membrane protein YhaH (DUF805 family)